MVRNKVKTEEEHQLRVRHLPDLAAVDGTRITLLKMLPTGTLGS